MTGVSRHTGMPIDNLASAYQGVEVVLTTRIGSRVMRREFGGGAVELLGRLVTPTLFAAFQQLVGTAIDLWEPRFHVRRVQLKGSPETLRAGAVGLVLEAEYRPRGHLGDDSVERVVNFGVIFGDGRVRVGA